jgi:hypothetical protein
MSIDLCNRPTVLADLGNVDLIPRHIRLTARTEKELPFIDAEKMIHDFQKPILKEDASSNNHLEKHTNHISTRTLVDLIYSRFDGMLIVALALETESRVSTFDGFNLRNLRHGEAGSMTDFSSQGAAW